jgi:hypothetical protein
MLNEDLNREFPLGVQYQVEVMGVALDGTVIYNVYKPGETGRRLLKAFLLQRLKLQELLGDTTFQGGEITMTYRDANGNMSST